MMHDKLKTVQEAKLKVLKVYTWNKGKVQWQHMEQ